MGHLTEQEVFWAGSFGREYIDRNDSDVELAARTALLANVLRNVRVESAIELGCNIGLNLHALRRLLPGAALAGVEINKQAAARASDAGFRVFCDSLLDFRTPLPFDLALTCGVLIHIHPDRLADAYATLEQATGRYLAIVEYYNPTPVEVPYRGHRDRLFKRDFAGELIDRHHFRLVDCGFAYHRSPFALDDLNWFLLERSQ